jgi:hypothetical protein
MATPRRTRTSSGSVPLRSADEVFRVLSERLGDRVRQLPDGETGPRADWIVWQYPVLSSRPQFEVAQPAPGAYRALPAPPARHAPEVGAGSPSTEPVKRS